MRLLFLFIFSLSSLVPSRAQVTVVAPIKRADKDALVSVEIEATASDTIATLEFTLNWDSSVLAFQKADTLSFPPSQFETFNLTNSANGSMKFIWLTIENDGVKIKGVTKVFRITFKAIGAAGKTSVLQFTKLKANNGLGVPYAVVMKDGSITVNGGSAVGEVSNTEGGIKLLQNVPNPVENQTTVFFELKEASDAALEIYDAEGRMIYEKKGYFDAGKHEMWFNTEGVLSKGTYIYGIRTKQGFVHRTLIKI